MPQWSRAGCRRDDRRGRYPRRVDPIVPELHGASLAGIVPALVGGRPAPWMPEAVEGAESVVLLLLDGFGRHALDDHADVLPVLASMEQRTITTVAPSTTSTALTSLVTGLPP